MLKKKGMPSKLYEESERREIMDNRYNGDYYKDDDENLLGPISSPKVFPKTMEDTNNTDNVHQLPPIIVTKSNDNNKIQGQNDEVSSF